MRSLIIILFVVSLVGCYRDAPIWIYKSGMKDKLIEICDNNSECIAAVSENFDKCADDAAIEDMIMTISPEESEKKNKQIVRELVTCINREGQGQYFTID